MTFSPEVFHAFFFLLGLAAGTALGYWLRWRGERRRWMRAAMADLERTIERAQRADRERARVPQGGC